MEHHHAHLCTVYDFFHATVVEFNSCNNDHTVHKAKKYLRSSLHGNVCLPLLYKTKVGPLMKRGT